MTGQYTVSFGPGKPSPGVKWIMIVTGVSFILQNVIGINYDYWFGLNKPFWLAPWQAVTYMFLHSTTGFLPFHLIFNMLLVWMFGVPFERQFGTKSFLKLYFISGIGTGLLMPFFIPFVYGASAAVFGLLVSFAYFWPNARILVMFIFPMKAKTMILITMFLELWFTINNAPSDKIAHSGHIFGAVIAFIYLQIVYKRYPIFRSFIQKMNNRVEQVSSRRKEKKQAEIINKEQWTRDKVDELLEKVSKQGVGSLTKKEKEFLDRVSMDYKSTPDDGDD